jgi:hypothetical protein
MNGAGDVRVDERDKPTLQAPLGVTNILVTVCAALGLAVVAPACTSRVRGAVRS